MAPHNMVMCLLCAALAWAAKRWTRALMLKIQTWHGNVKALSMALANSQSNDLTHLEEVCPLDCSHHCHRSHSKLLSRPVGLRVRQLHVENEGGDSQLACEIACTWLLTQARNIKVMCLSNSLHVKSDILHNISAIPSTGAHHVQVLNAKITCFDSFGAARGLKHLMLHVTGVDDDCLSSSLSVLERLRTLWISRVTISEQQTSGALHLSALHSLDRLALENYVPRTIQLAESCELHVVHFSLFAAEHAVWDTVLPNLRSFMLDSCDQELLALPSCLRNASNLAAVWVDIECFGTAAAPLQLHGALAHVAELTVQCTHLHAVVPLGVSWQHINFSARGVLDMRAEALSSFAEAIPALCFRYHSLQVRCLLPSWVFLSCCNNSPAPTKVFV